jgi:hypothetical protein
VCLAVKRTADTLFGTFDNIILIFVKLNISSALAALKLMDKVEIIDTKRLMVRLVHKRAF